jgi:hypothetical protein
MSIALSSIRACLDGGVPAALATCSADGIPNVSYVSEVHYVDHHTVALSYQFFNKTRANVCANPIAEALIIDPASGSQFRLDLHYLRTETSGPLFESMRVKLAGIAAHSGMTSVFRLLGSDVYEVTEVSAVCDAAAPALSVQSNWLPGLRRCSAMLAACRDLEGLLEALLGALHDDLSISHAMLFLHDEPGERLYLLGSHGYEVSGIGSEIPLGYGIVGIAAAECTPIRITHMAEEFRYGEAVRDSLIRSGVAATLEAAIPMPGLDAPAAQLAVPILADTRLLGVLFVESATDGAFGYDSEDVLVTIANQFATALVLLQRHRTVTIPPGPALATQSSDRPLRVRYYASNSSVFLDEDYLIKGVAGAIFWKLVREYHESGRTEFNNRQLRLDPDIRLPAVSENLEARLVPLKRRLRERGDDIAITPVARGKFRLDVARPLSLETADALAV